MFISELFIGALIFYFVIRKWQGIKFLIALKAFLAYELASFLLYLIYPFPLFFRLFHLNFFKILDLPIFITILFVIFYFIMKRYFALNLKRSLLVFLLVIVIAFFVLNVFQAIVTKQILELSVFDNENLQMQKQIGIFMQNTFNPLPHKLSDFGFLQLIGKLESGTTSWLGEAIRKLITITIYD
jgi:hypothetical protein